MVETPASTRPAKLETSQTQSPTRLRLPTVLSHNTIRRPAFYYIHLILVSFPGVKLSSNTISTQLSVDALTARTHLTAALQRFLGLSGTAIPIDILKCEGANVWIRVPNEDGSAVIEALSGWVGESEQVAWRVRESGVWLGGIGMGDGRNLFE